MASGRWCIGFNDRFPSVASSSRNYSNFAVLCKISGVDLRRFRDWFFVTAAILPHSQLALLLFFGILTVFVIFIVAAKSYFYEYSQRIYDPDDVYYDGAF